MRIRALLLGLAVVVAGITTGVVLATRHPAVSPAGSACQGEIIAPTSLTSTYRPDLGVAVPVPTGWTANAEQGSPYPTTVIGPPCFIPHGARFLVAHMRGMTMDDALLVRCAALSNPPGVTPTPLPATSRPPIQGPQTVDGHAGSYQFVCPGGFVGQEWTVLIPAAGGNGVWHVSYLGATGLGTGPWALSFHRVVAAFSAP